MKLQSKIRSMFSSELLDLIASICDTRRIDSYAQKMKILRDLLYTNGVKFDVLGGATNRIAMFIDGYAVKFAMDDQGYRDNLIEYSICDELQPYVTKAYETNGYILVAECVRLMSKSEFVAKKQDILNILLNLSDDYLLGDVGFLQKNRTNWGVRDNGEIVILDYAYCHRATENLFTCPVCGDGVLAYTSDFDKLICTNRSVCHATFTYIQRKQDQGDQVDFDMIDERKADSIVLREGETYVEVDDKTEGKFLFKDGKKVVLVNDDISYKKMMEANKMISTQFDREEALDALVKMSMTKDSDAVAREAAIQNLDNLTVSDSSEEYMLTEEYQQKIDDSILEEQRVEEYDEDDEAYSLGYLISLASGKAKVPKDTSQEKVSTTEETKELNSESYEDDEEEDGLSYLISLSMRNNQSNYSQEEESCEEEKEDEPVEVEESEESENMNQEKVEEVVEKVETREPEKIQVSSVYGEMGNPSVENDEKPKVGMILDGEHL